VTEILSCCAQVDVKDWTTDVFMDALHRVEEYGKHGSK